AAGGPPRPLDHRLSPGGTHHGAARRGRGGPDRRRAGTGVRGGGRARVAERGLLAVTGPRPGRSAGAASGIVLGWPAGPRERLADGRALFYGVVRRAPAAR